MAGAGRHILYVDRLYTSDTKLDGLLCDLLGFTGDNPSAEEAYQHKGGHSLVTLLSANAESSPAGYTSGGARNVSASPVQKQAT